jgi:hypothetical protein
MMSKPCVNCISHINTTLKKKNYKIYKGAYTTDNGDLCRF